MPYLAVLDVEGPAAEAYLRMEEGLHRRYAPAGADERIRVRVLAQGSRPSKEPAGISAVRQRNLAFDIDVAYRARLHLGARAMRLDLLGPERGLLAHAVHDLAREWNTPPTAPPETVRIYKEDGQGARDPRTGAVVGSYKDVLRGRLDSLLEAWRRRQAVESSSGGYGPADEA